MFSIYFQLGVEHILDWTAADHLAFIIVMCSIYLIQDWKKILFLVSAFTVGHSITLILGGLGLIPFNQNLIEILIPLTIMGTAIYYAFIDTHQSLKFTYFMIASFGLIHGLGFSNYFSSLFDSSGAIILPLFYFNLGVEFGQLLIVGVFLLLSFIFVRYFKIPHKNWSLFTAGLGFGMAVQILLTLLG